jgi:plasmid stability protein
MSTQTVTLQIPDELYAQFRQRADRSQRSVEAEVLTVLTEAVSESDELPPELAQAIEPLARLGDREFWEAARGQLPAEVSAELQLLHHKQQRDGLSGPERERADELCLEYDRAMLVRARAAVLLKERGYDVGSLLEKP